MYTPISVESRVKAHISTAYIDADGRGVREQYSKDHAPCMQDPAEFRKIELGNGPEALLYERVVVEAEELAARNEGKSAGIRSTGAQYLVDQNRGAAGPQIELEAHRRQAREADREADEAHHFQLYQKRNESAMAQRAFDESLKPTTESVVRDREESVGRRYRELMALRNRANAAQSQSIQQAHDRKVAASAINEAALAKKLSEQADKERSDILATAKEAYSTIVRERERATQMRRLEEEVQLKANVQFLMWARERDETQANAQRLAAIATDAEKQAHDAQIDVNAALQARSYADMKAMHARLEAMCNALEREIKSVNRHGSCLDALMVVAKEKAVERGKAFHALVRVCRGTYVPTVYTPSVLPQPEKMAITVGAQTNVSEPIRPPSQQKGRRPSNYVK